MSEIVSDDTDGNIQSADGSLVAGRVEFTSLDMWVPPCRDGTMLLPVTLTFYEAGASSAVPGDESQLNWFAGVGSSFRARDLTTGRPIVRATRFVASAPMVFHENVPSFYPQDDTPSGDVVPGLQETLRYGVEVLGDDASGFYSQSEVLHQVLTVDTTGSGWNTCERLGSVTWELYDWEGSDYDWDNNWVDSSPYLLDATWEFYTRDGTPCEDVPSEELWYAVAVVDYGLVTWAENLFSVYMDSSGASAGDELMLRTVNQSGVESLGLNSLVWTDGDFATEFDGTYVDTEVDGGILQFVDLCGDGVLGTTEACDGSELDGQDCVSQGFSSGTLECTSSCEFDTSACRASGGGGGGGGGGASSES